MPSSPSAPAEALADAAPAATGARNLPLRQHRRSKKTATHHWSRLLHVYTSLACFLVVLFFSITGLTLNHPTWTFGGSGSTAHESGTLPLTFKNGAEVDWLQVAEFLRSEHSLRGAVNATNADETQGSISFRGPGYAADAFFEVPTGSYEIDIKSQGPLGVANDLHKGRDTKSSFKWLIDASAILLIVISLTGLTMQFFLRKRRRSALWSAAVGGVVFLLFVVWAIR